MARLSTAALATFVVLGTCAPAALAQGEALRINDKPKMFC
jgi:hypothetical protein